MVNKKGMWFLTLFSLILVLGVYYATMPNNKDLNSLVDNVASIKEEKEEAVESSVLVALRVEKEEQVLKTMDELNEILTSKDSSVEQKNEAFEKMKGLNSIKAEEEQIENLINKEFKTESFVRVTDDSVKVVVTKLEKSVNLANKIMNCVKTNYNNTVYVTVEFK